METGDIRDTDEDTGQDAGRDAGRDAGVSMTLGVVIRKSPAQGPWAEWVWRAVGVLPGADDAHWAVLRREGAAVEYHAATVELELHPSDAPAYLAELSTRVPSVYVVLRNDDDPASEHEIEVALATVSPFEAQDYADTGEEMIEQVPMPPGLRQWVSSFAEAHHDPAPFVKRRRDRASVSRVDDGVGDARIRQASDVYRAPRRKGEVIQ